MSDLLTMADRCEAATGPDRELFEDVFRECFPKPERIWVTDNTGPWTDEYTEWQARQSRFYELLDAGASLDAAMTLVPEGCVWTLDGGYTRAMNSAEIGPEPTGGELMQAIASGEGETPALALCAAALKARHTQAGDGE